MSLPFPLGYYRPHLKAILGLPNDDRVKLVGAFQDTPLVSSVAMLTAEVSRRAEMPASTLEPVVRALTALAIPHARGSVDDARSFARELIQAAGEDRQLREAFGSVLNDTTAEQIGAILACELSVRATAKALDISGQSERVVSESRIISDIRPVFGDQIAEPLHAVILHTLRLECIGEFQHQHFLLSSQALRELKDVVERALTKEAALIRGLESAEGLRLQVFADAEEA
jgi:hypothetical protein